MTKLSGVKAQKLIAALRKAGFEVIRISNILAEWRGVLVTPAEGDLKRITPKVSDLTSRSLQGDLHSAKMLPR